MEAREQREQRDVSHVRCRSYPSGTGGEQLIDITKDVDLPRKLASQDMAGTTSCISALRELVEERIPAEIEFRKSIVKDSCHKSNEKEDSLLTRWNVSNEPRWLKEEIAYLDAGKALHERLENMFKVMIRELYRTRTFDACRVYLDREKDHTKALFERDTKECLAKGKTMLMQEMYDSYFDAQQVILLEFKEALNMAQHLFPAIGFDLSGCQFEGSPYKYDYRCSSDPSYFAFCALSNAAGRVISHMNIRSQKNENDSSEGSVTSLLSKILTAEDSMLSLKEEFAYSYLHSLYIRACESTYDGAARWTRICLIATGFPFARYMEKYHAIYEKFEDMTSSSGDMDPDNLPSLQEPRSLSRPWFSSTENTGTLRCTKYYDAVTHPDNKWLCFRPRCPTMCRPEIYKDENARKRVFVMVCGKQAS